MAIFVFKRTEKKYLLTDDMYRDLMTAILPRLVPDKYCRSTVCSLYLDTPDFRMIRASIDARTYKEKLRVRCYGIPGEEDVAFLEIKKKFEGVVYKRREAMPLSSILRYLEEGRMPLQSQIMREIDYTWRVWQMPQPAALLAYEREAYVVKEQPSVRLTFDTNVRYRTEDLLLQHGHNGNVILPKGTVLLEIKTEGAMPLFLAHALDALSIYPTSYSKYGTAYAEFSRPVCGDIAQNKQKGVFRYA